MFTEVIRTTKKITALTDVIYGDHRWRCNSIFRSSLLNMFLVYCVLKIFLTFFRLCRQVLVLHVESQYHISVVHVTSARTQCGKAAANEGPCGLSATGCKACYVFARVLKGQWGPI